MLERHVEVALAAAPRSGAWSVRFEETRQDTLSVIRGVPRPPNKRQSIGAMVTVWRGNGLGYAATSDLSLSGLSEAFRSASAWAESAKDRALQGLAPKNGQTPVRKAAHKPNATKEWEAISQSSKIAALADASAKLKADDRIVDWGASLNWTGTNALLLTSEGGEIHHALSVINPYLYATAHQGAIAETRSFGNALVRQGGFEILDDNGFANAAPRVAAEALQLVEAPPCPSGTMDAVIAADQMVLQIHESIGHPLELDRILGDERNYAGTSFVTADMFGTFRYGSEHLNITFDPDVEGEASSYSHDDEGTEATREFLIKNGVLLRPLGSATSQRRANLSGVANARACAWNRPPIDRMANLNLEPGHETRESLIARVERGIYMETNRAWSIDDSRNKFQFSCEYGRLIENGRLTRIVRNPSYRGISKEFWRKLSGVGNAQNRQVLGALYCGKGEPNQAIRVGHATPDCLFKGIDVFGAA